MDCRGVLVVVRAYRTRRPPRGSEFLVAARTNRTCTKRSPVRLPPSRTRASASLAVAFGGDIEDRPYERYRREVDAEAGVHGGPVMTDRKITGLRPFRVSAYGVLRGT